MLTFRSQGNLYFGEGVTRGALGAIFDAHGYKRPALIYDSKVDVGELLSMDYAGMIALDCSREPTYDDLDTKVKQVRLMIERRKWDCVVAIGGGSTLDMAKAIAALINNAAPRAIEFKGFDKLTVPGVPVIAIPSTLSGSESTYNASFIDTETKTKMGINGRFMMAEHAILDPHWLPDTGSRAWASTYLDALTHAYESGVCVKANDITRMMSDKALELLKTMDLMKCMIGASLAARALMNSGSGIAGALSYPLGVHYGVPHGIAGGIFLPDVMRFNGSAEHEWIDGVLDAFKLSRDLRDYGVKTVEELHRLILPLQAAFDQNPKKFDADKDGRALIEGRMGAVQQEKPIAARRKK